MTSKPEPKFPVIPEHADPLADQPDPLPALRIGLVEGDVF